MNNAFDALTSKNETLVAENASLTVLKAGYQDKAGTLEKELTDKRAESQRLNELKAQQASQISELQADVLNKEQELTALETSKKQELLRLQSENDAKLQELQEKVQLVEEARAAANEKAEQLSAELGELRGIATKTKSSTGKKDSTT